ncbi:MAG TPA: hypothetical protein VIK89_13450 [Cytophagaceae bacterium]
MKVKLLAFCSLFFLLKTQMVSAQTIPNSGFEDWDQSSTFEKPVNIIQNSNAESFYNTGVATMTKVQGVTGYAMRLENKLAPNGDNLLAYASWGEASESGFSKGVPLPSEEPLDGVTMKLRYSLSTGFRGFIAIIPTKDGVPAGDGNGVIPGAYVYYIEGDQPSFTTMNFTFEPSLTENPDSCMLFIAAAELGENSDSGKPGDFIEVDDIAFIGTSDIFLGGNLEEWEEGPSVELPKEWRVEVRGLNYLTFQKSSDAFSGNYSIQLKNIVESEGRRVLGKVMLGDEICPGNGSDCTPLPGMKINSVPRSIGFYYKYFTSGVDSATCSVNLLKSGVGNVARGWNYFLPTNDWKFGVVSIAFPDEIPDSAKIAFEAGRWETAVDGSTLLIDDVKFHYCDEEATINGPSSVCVGASGVQFSINEEFASGYQWSTTVGTISSGETEPTVVIDGILEEGTITVVKTYMDGCPDKTFELNISVANNANADAGQNQTLCADNATVSLNGVITGAVTGSWSSSGSGDFDDPASIITVYYPSSEDIAAGSVELTLTTSDDNGCQSVSDVMQVTFEPVPTVDAGEDDLVCDNSISIALNGTITGAPGGQWTTSGIGTITDDDALTTTYMTSVADVVAGSVTFTLTSTGSQVCAAATDEVVYTFTVCTGVDSNLGSLNVNYYPNPAKDVVTFELGKSVKVMEMVIVDELIQTEKTIIVNDVTDKIDLNFSDINLGVHMVIIRTEEGAIMKKVIKM